LGSTSVRHLPICSCWMRKQALFGTVKVPSHRGDEALGFLNGLKAQRCCGDSIECSWHHSCNQHPTRAPRPNWFPGYCWQASGSEAPIPAHAASMRGQEAFRRTLPNRIARAPLRRSQRFGGFQYSGPPSLRRRRWREQPTAWSRTGAVTTAPLLTHQLRLAS
jgi:hypothetical protein